MRTLNKKYTLIIIFLLSSTLTFSQSKNDSTYYTNEISLQCESGKIRLTSWETGKTNLAQNIILYENVSRISFLSDSLISISNTEESDLKLSINKINRISIKSGTNTGVGIALGALAGLLAGAITGALVGSTYNTSSSGLGAIGTPFGL